MTEQTIQPAGQGAERRRNPRYRLATPLTGYIEHQFKRYSGRVLDLSMSGFRLFVPHLETLLRGPDHFDFGEVVCDKLSVGAFGRIAFSRLECCGMSIGFEWDALDKPAARTLDGLVNELLQQRKAGWVKRQGDRVDVGGHVSAALADDLFTAVREGVRHVSLGHATSLDPGGLDMLLSLHEAGIQFDGAHSELRDVLSRFQLWPLAPAQV